MAQQEPLDEATPSPQDAAWTSLGAEPTLNRIDALVQANLLARPLSRNDALAAAETGAPVSALFHFPPFTSTFPPLLVPLPLASLLRTRFL